MGCEAVFRIVLLPFFIRAFIFNPQKIKKMRKEVHISNWLFLSRIFLQCRKSFGIAILIILTFGLFSNDVSAQRTSQSAAPASGGLTMEDFGGGIPTTWAISSNQTVSSNWVASTPAEGYLGTPGAKVNPALNNTVGTTAEYFLISPQFTTPNESEIRFWTKQGSFVNKGAVYQLRLSTATQPDINSFNVVVASWTEAQLNSPATTYVEKIVPLTGIPEGIPVYLAFVAVTNQDAANISGTSGDIWFVDNIRVIESCSKVTGITSNMSATNGTISWTHPLANNFEIHIVDENTGFTGSGTPVTGTTFNATTLTNGNPLVNGTTYDVYIKTVCDATTSSGWAGPFKITTTRLGLSCATPVVIPSNIATAPYVLSTNLDTFYDNQNYTPLDSESLSCQPFGSTMNWLSGDHAFLTYTPTTSGLVNVKMEVNSNYSNGCYNTLSSVFIFDSCNIGTTANCLASLTTGQSSNDLSSQIQNMYVQAGQTYYFVISSPFQHNDTQPGASICFTFTLSQPTCPTPSGLSYNNLTQTGATFSWSNPQNLVNNWEYVVKTSPSTPTGADVIFPASSNNNNNSPLLTAATTYYLYVRSVCGGTAGAWSDPLTFRTPCNIQPLPYYTGFEDSAKNDCWSQLNLNNDSDFFHFGNNGFNEPVAKLRTSNAESNTNDMLISPQFHLDGVTQKRLRFKYNIYGNWGLIVDNPTGGPGSFEIKISTSGIGAQSFTIPVVDLASYTTAYNFIEMVVPIPNIVGDINIAWIIPPGATQTGTWIYIDDVYIEDLPACSEPSYPVVNVNSITSTSAEVSWTNGYNSSQWELVAQPLGTGTPTTPPATGAVVNIVNTNPFTITGLDPSTRYEFYVRTYCSSALQSTWAGPTNFNTLCIAQPTPYVESFNDTDVTTKKFCWSTNNVDGDPAEWRISGTEASIYPQPVNFFEPFASYNDWLISVPVNAVGAKRVRFKYRVVTSPFFPSPRGNFEVLMSSTPDFSTYTTLIPMHDFSNPNFMEDSVLFNGTGITYFAFRLPPNMTNPSETGIVYVDDFVVEDAPACPNPSHQTVANITATSANLAWTRGYNETKWEIVVQGIGIGMPTGSGTTVNTTPTFNAAGLTPDTVYEYYVRAVCNATESSEWVGPFTFRTDCNVLNTPFIETFDTNTTTETCWKIVNANADGNSWNLDQTVSPMFGDQMAALFTGMNGNNNDWLITPTLKARPGQRLRFYYKVYNEFFEEDLKVMLSTSGAATSQFSTILYENNLSTTTDATGTVAGSNTITVASSQGIRIGDVVYIPGFPIPYATTVIAINGTTITLSENATDSFSGVQHVSFTHETINNTEPREMVINLTNITGPTDINIAFHTPYFPPNPWNYRGQYTFIDNVVVEDIPACPSVINVATGVITDTTAVINWEVTGTETSWEISVQPFGTPAPVGSTLPQYLQTATSHPYTITGLTPSTRYQVYIRAVCSSSSQSEWVGPFDVLTKCDSANICQYTISLSNGNTGQVYRGLNVVQNGIVLQTLTFPIDAPNQPTVIDHQVFLCSGIEFSLYWDGSGSGTQYSEAQAVIRDQSGNVVWTSPLGLGTINTNIYTGVSNCNPITCAQPTNLTVSNTGVLSWTPGGSETQWEVFIQPLGQGSIPQSGVIVNSPSYTPQASDFFYPTAGTYEFFVRAVCGDTNKSYWTGPKVFIRNDEPSTAIRLQINSNGTCTSQGTNASFIGATASNVPTSCGGTNGGDIWYEFVATSKVHTVELSNFNPGSYYTSAYMGTWPKIILSLYEVQTDGSLVEKACSENNSLVTTYSSELTVGKTYKVRVKYDASAANDKRFDICVSTPADICDMNSFNYSFEKLPMQNVTGISTIIDATVVPGWRVNTDWQTMFFQEGTLGDAIAYEGGQYVQLTQDGEDAWDPNDPNIKGLYKDFDTSEITVMDYSFASATRRANGTGTTVQLFAGPPSGPFTVIAEDHADSLIWDLIQGSYIIPNGQTTTRFIFRVVGNAIGHILDAADFKANTKVKNVALTLGCTETSTIVEAEGIGSWSADASNPAATVIATPNAKMTAISGFTTPGVYVYHWITRYCDSTVTITYQGVTALPTVASEVTYCTNETASALTANAPANHTLLWYTQAVGGIGSTTAPIPNVSVVGSTMYYVSAVDANGCIGPRAVIEVIVNETITPNVGFTYNNNMFCKNDPNPVITMDPNFTTGGTFSAQPNGLDIDPTTGEINLLSSSGGVYTITYEIVQSGCSNAGAESVSLTVDASCVDIPRGFSPNNDGANESFDLTGLDVRNVIIYNRYGTEVYSYSGDYTNQWKGVSNKGDKLPDGTYFYTITKADGATVTGWVYINR